MKTAKKEVLISDFESFRNLVRIEVDKKLEEWETERKEAEKVGIYIPSRGKKYLAQEMNIDKDTLYKIYNVGKKYNPKLDMIIKISEYFNYDLCWIK